MTVMAPSFASFRLGAAVLLAGVMALALPLGVRAAGATTTADLGTADLGDVVQAQVLPGWRTARGTRMIALKLTLAPDWHTYWRTPGEAGIPPRFDWSASRNLASVKINWPRPEVFDLNGLRSIGYLDALVLPVELTPVDPSRPILLNAKVDLGVCHNICLPASVKVSADLTGKGAPDPAIRTALASRPEGRRAGGVTGASCTATPIADGLRLTAELTMPAQGGRELTVFELPNPDIWVSEARTERHGSRLTATADLVPADGKPFALDRSALTITVLGTRGVVELHGCAAAG